MVTKRVKKTGAPEVSSPDIVELAPRCVDIARVALHLEHVSLHLVWNHDQAWGKYAEIGPEGEGGTLRYIITLSAHIANAKVLVRTVCHELAHIPLMPIDRLAGSWAEVVDEGTRATYARQWSDAMEGTVNYLEEVLYPVVMLELGLEL